jgi:hypothetical protein
MLLGRWYLVPMIVIVPTKLEDPVKALGKFSAPLKAICIEEFQD